MKTMPVTPARAMVTLLGLRPRNVTSHDRGEEVPRADVARGSDSMAARRFSGDLVEAPPGEALPCRESTRTTIPLPLVESLFSR